MKDRTITMQVGRDPRSGLWHAELVIPDGEGNMRSLGFKTMAEAQMAGNKALAVANKHFTDAGFQCQLEPEKGTIQ